VQLHRKLEGDGSKGVLIGEELSSAVALGVEEGNSIEVEEVLPSSVPMLHKHSINMRPTTEGYTGDRR
jgi:hypothetical protein